MDIAHMYGPYFLIFYGAIAAIVLLGCIIFLKDKTVNLPLPVVPERPDPYELAYLRGGEREVLKLIGFNLICQGYLQSDSLKPQENIDRSNLQPLEDKVIDWCDRFRVGTAMTDSTSLQSAVKDRLTSYEQWLLEEQLLNDDRKKMTARIVSAIAITIILGLAGYKLIWALSLGHHNVGFLIAIAILTTVLIIHICRLSRLTARGKNYLQQLQQTFKDLKGEFDPIPTEPDDRSMLLVGLYGIDILRQTPYDSYSRLFSSPVASTSSSCSTGGCSSSSSCGSSCGGGCGGCGGCGG